MFRYFVLVLMFMLSLSCGKDVPAELLFINIDNYTGPFQVNYSGYYALISDQDGNILTHDTIGQDGSLSLENVGLEKDTRVHLTILRIFDDPFIEQKTISLNTYMDIRVGRSFSLKSRNGLIRPEIEIQFDDPELIDNCIQVVTSATGLLVPCLSNVRSPVYLYGDYVLFLPEDGCSIGIKEIARPSLDSTYAIPDLVPLEFLEPSTNGYESLQFVSVNGARISYRENDNFEYFREWIIPPLCEIGKVPDITPYFDFFIPQYTYRSNDRDVCVTFFTDELLQPPPQIQSDFTILTEDITRASISSSNPGSYYQGSWGHNDFLNKFSMNWSVIGPFEDPFVAPDIFEVFETPFEINLDESTLRLSTINEVHLSKFPTYEDYLDFYHYSDDEILSDFSEIDELGAYRVVVSE